MLCNYKSISYITLKDRRNKKKFQLKTENYYPQMIHFEITNIISNKFKELHTKNQRYEILVEEKRISFYSFRRIIEKIYSVFMNSEFFSNKKHMINNFNPHIERHVNVTSPNLYKVIIDGYAMRFSDYLMSRESIRIQIKLFDIIDFFSCHTTHINSQKIYQVFGLIC